MSGNDSSGAYDAIIMMGVSGCGKTTCGRAIAEQMQLTFVDGDDYHPAANIAKMAGGTPLDDSDRAPWLKALRQRLRQAQQDRAPVVLACSALKATYREQLAFVGCRFAYVYLEGSFSTLMSRLRGRTGHFMPSELLQSQFDILEIPPYGLTVSIEGSIDETIAATRTALSQPPD